VSGELDCELVREVLRLGCDESWLLQLVARAGAVRKPRGRGTSTVVAAVEQRQ
jgi:hypothetical protein